MKTITKLWLLITLLIILVPAGLILPRHFNAGCAWGEWGNDRIKVLIGYIPAGMEKLSSLWNAPIPNYALRKLDGKSFLSISLAYVISAIAGILVITGIVFLIGKFLNKKGRI